MRKVYVLLGTFESKRTFVVGVYSSHKKAEYIKNKMVYNDPETTWSIETEVLQ